MRAAATLRRVNGSHIPAAWVAAGRGVPDLCGRHGEPAVEHRKVSMFSRPPAWSYVLILGGVLLFVIVALALRKTVVAPRWPFCTRCLDLRSRRRKTGLALLGGALAVLVASFATAIATTNANVGATVLGIGNLLFLAGLIAGLVVLTQSAWRAVAAAVVSGDGLWVSVPATVPLSRGVEQPAPTAQ